MEGDKLTILKRKIRSLENEKAMLEKRLKFSEYLTNMRNSTKLEEEELLDIKKQLLELQKENSQLRDELRKKQVVVVNTERLELASKSEEIKTLQKMLKNERKIHKVDLMVLTNLQTVPITYHITTNRTSTR